LKILLVAPCVKGERRHSNLDIPQLTLSLLAGMTPPEHEIEICEEVFGQTINFEGDYDLVGISIMTQTAIRGYEIANLFRLRGKTVVFGGIHATSLPHEAIRYGDSVVIGEAEGLWPTVLEDAAKNRLQKFYKLSQLPDLQNYVHPRRDLVQCTSGKFAIAPIETTRGCPYNCDFCSVSRFYGTRQRHKPIRKIIEEAEACPEKFLFFLDDNITFDRKYALELFRELAPLKKRWVGQASINLSKDDELMQAARKSGCGALLFGFESITHDGLNSYRKTLKTIDANIEAIKRLRGNGILTMASIVFGLDTDDNSVFDLTYEFLAKSKPAFFQACVLTPYPGTPVFDNLKAQGRILTDDWTKYDATKVIVDPLGMSSEQLLAGINQVQEDIYSRASILKRALPNMMLGPVEALLYFSLNRGYRKRFVSKSKIEIQRNQAGSPVDFEVSKYVEAAYC
jgi:radical SAM superfamily enzyme YgiQ (UPF0313 family)